MSIRDHLLIICLLATALALLPAAEPADPAPHTPIAVWSLGQGTIAEIAAKPGSDILIGQHVATGANQPAKLELAAPLAGSLTLSPNAALTLLVEQVGDARELVIDLDTGAVQVDLHDKGAFAALRVRGAAIDVRVTGTLFVVQRVKRDADYIALIQGKVKTGLRKEVSDALGKGQVFDLESRQGVEASVSGGLGQIATLTNRPQIVSLLKSIKDQATGPQQGDGGWNLDLALDLLNDLLDHLGLDDALLTQLTDALGEALFEDLHTGPGDQVINTIYSTPSGSGALAPPPPPPGN